LNLVMQNLTSQAKHNGPIRVRTSELVVGSVGGKGDPRKKKKKTGPQNE